MDPITLDHGGDAQRSEELRSFLRASLQFFPGALWCCGTLTRMWNRMLRGVWAGLLSWAVALSPARFDTVAIAGGDQWAARELAAPPEDIRSGRLSMPQPATYRSTHSLEDVTASRSMQGTAVVDRTVNHPGGRLSLAVAMVASQGWRIVLSDPADHVVYDSMASDGERNLGTIVEHRVGDLGALVGGTALAGHPVERLDVLDAIQGAWRLVLTGPPAAIGTRGVVIVGQPMQDGVGDPATELRVRWRDLAFRAGAPITIDVESDATLVELVAEVSRQDGATLRSNLVRDERDARGAAIVFVPEQAGDHLVMVRAKVRGVNGRIVDRSCALLAAVAAAGGRFTGTALRTKLDDVRDRIVCPLDAPAADEVVLIAAEVWSVQGTVAQPVCWLANLCDTGPQRQPSLVFDRRWLGRAGVSGGSLELRNLRMHDRNTLVPLDVVARVPLGDAPSPLPFAAAQESVLLGGRPGGHAVAASIEVAPIAQDAPPSGSHALMLVHGYCSGGVTFPPSQFTGPVSVFLDPEAARSNDEFAQLILAQSAGLKSFGVVAHSQGGLASLHLYTFYWSGLNWSDAATAGTRRLQSVGSPYQGTPLAGNLAILGQIFGFGCGSVFDLSYDGASLWLSTIPTWARANVWYWTTQYLDIPFSYDYCDLISDLFLSNPDDGVVEKVKGQLPGANNMGHKQGWCHTTGMDDPPQYNDATRNAEMNATGAR